MSLHEPSIPSSTSRPQGVDPIARRFQGHADRPLARRRRDDDFRHHPALERGDRARSPSRHYCWQGASAAGAPQELVKERAASLEDCLSAILLTRRHRHGTSVRRQAAAAEGASGRSDSKLAGYVYARRDSSSCQDRSGSAFALVGPDHSRSPSASIPFIENLETATSSTRTTRRGAATCSGCLEGSRYFGPVATIVDNEAERRPRSGNTQIVVEVLLDPAATFSTTETL